MMVSRITFDDVAHFMWVRISEDRSHFEVVQDVTYFREDNRYRYVRHASVRGDRVVFCSELGKDSNKIVVFEVVQGEVKVIGEIAG